MDVSLSCALPLQTYELGKNFDPNSKAVNNEASHFGVSESQSHSKYNKASVHSARPDLVIQDNFLKRYDDLWFSYDAHGQQQSLFDMAKLFEEESSRLKNDTNIRDDIRTSNLNALERGFIDALKSAIQGLPGGVSNKIDFSWTMDSVNDFARNVINNIQVSGLSDEIKGLMFKALDEVVSFRYSVVKNQAISRAAESYMESLFNIGIRSRADTTLMLNVKKKEIVALIDEKNRPQRDEYKAMLHDALNKIERPSTIVPNAIDEENSEDETSTEVSNADDSHEDTSSENTAEGA